MNKKKFAEIVKFNVEKSIQNKWFIIFNIIMCIITIFAVNTNNIDKILEQNNIKLFEEEFNLEIIDENNFSKGMFEKIYGNSEGIKISYVESNEYTKENIPDDLIVVEFKLDESNLLKTIITSKEAVDTVLFDNIKEISKNIRSEIFSNKIGISVQELEILNQEPQIQEIMLGVDAENSEIKSFIKDFSVIVVYMVLVLVLSRIANEIAQEKISKSIEYVLTSVSAKEYLLAKVISVTLTIVIQLLYNLVYYLIGNGINLILNVSEISELSQTSTSVSVDMSIVSYIVAMAVYLIFTVFFMCMIQGAISAKTTSVAEASNTTTLLLVITIVLYIISLACIGPYINVSTAMYVISCIPIVSTFFVPTMMIIGQATGLQILVSFILLIISVPLVFNKCAKKFKDGILDYSSKNNKTKKIKQNKSIKEEQEFLMKSSKMNKFGFVIGMALLLWIVLQNLVTLLLPNIANELFDGIFSSKTINWLYMGVISIISLIIPSILIKSYTEDKYKITKKIDFKEALKIILMGWGAIVVINYLQQCVLEWIGSDYKLFTDDILVLAEDSLLDKIIFFIGIAIIPGIFEEIFVRKSILNYGKQFGNYFTIIVSAIIFGLLHLNLQQGIFAFLIGLIFGYIVLKTQNVKLTIILHILNNGLVALTSIFSNNQVVLNIIEYASLAIGIIGIVIAVIGYFKNRKKIKQNEKEKFKEEYKMIFTNYTFDLIILLFIILTIATENYLRIL